MIRKAKLDDIHELMAIEEECFAKPYSYDTFYNDLNDEKVIVFVEEIAGKIVAFISLYCFLGEANLQQIAVSNKFRNNKIAQNLVSYAISYLKGCNAEKLYLEVNEQNVVAISIYEKLGFKKVITRKNYYGNMSALIYEMML